MWIVTNQIAIKLIPWSTEKDYKTALHWLAYSTLNNLSFEMKIICIAYKVTYLDLDISSDVK